MGQIKILLKRGLHDTAGNVLPIAAIAMLVATAVVGSAVDISRAYRVKNRLQSACDAAVLAGRRAVSTNGFDTTAQKAAASYFNVNFNDEDQETTGTTFTPSSADNGVTVSGTVNTTLSTLIMRLFGFGSFSLSATCASSMGMGNADVMMVLDTTGSMSWDLANDDGVTTTRIEALREAMKNFYSTVATATSGTNARVRYGFVPFSSSVNVGKLIYGLDPDYLVDARQYQSREYNSTTMVWDYKQIEYDVSQYKSFKTVSTYTGNVGDEEGNYYGPPKTVYSVWAGCIQERSTTPAVEFNYNSSVDKITPVSARDVDLDDAPDIDDDDTKWAPMWPEVAYERFDWRERRITNNSNYGSAAVSPCPYEAQLLEEMDEDSFDEYADSLVPTGATYLDIGMIWGGRLLSPDVIFKNNVNMAPINGGEVSRHIVFMTDGSMDTGSYIQQAWGMEFWDRRVTANGSQHQDRRHTSRFLAVCEAIKAKGIRIWTIAFASGSSDDLTTCASDDSSFTAADADELNEAFQEIANEVGELRVTS